MPTPRIATISPPRAITGGRISIHGSGFPVSAPLPRVEVGASEARVTFASSTQIDVMLATAESGALAIRVEGADNEATVTLATPITAGLHQVDNPVFDNAGNLYLTYSGTRGQQVPVSIFRVTPGGIRESFSSSITNPTSMARSPEGDIYVSSRFEGAVYRLTEDGSAEVYAADLGIACGLAFAPDGTLYVGDRSGTIFEVARGGRARAFATLPSSVAAFHLALGDDGLYVTAPTMSARDALYRVDFSGQATVFQTGFGRPQGLAFSPDGVLHVVEALAGVSGLYRVVADRAPELVASGPKLVGLTFDAHGGLIVCSSDTAYRVTTSN